MPMGMRDVAPESATSRRWPGISRQVLALVIAGGVAAAHAGSGPSLSTYVIAGGGGFSQTPGACLKLDGTLGQSVAGSSSGGNFELSSGYWALRDALRSDSLFNNGFEECL
ncbi:hypothetical protein [Dokdonella immobilis]|uniref:Uncharacterized protein n=1 Tax=Dokdonella immobilis TaxID=578942 RepID=A0A1I5AWD6_9GAMM|nr:hypothetical protein [Dokdonella immobilis]SFN66539.1 hypothetical protein SAMN05216289_1449 [Dokdonella immobilis]